jgi:integrase
MRTFRDDIERLDRRLQGRAIQFKDRLTNLPEQQLKSATTIRYWKSVQSFFAWCAAEEDGASDDPTAGLKINSKKGEVKRTPEPFSQDELRRFFAAPLYTGYKSRKRPLHEGDCHLRADRWWAPVLLMFTGMRAGELSQLLPSDFVFDADTPHLRVRDPRLTSPEDGVEALRYSVDARIVGIKAELTEAPPDDAAHLKSGQRRDNVGHQRLKDGNVGIDAEGRFGEDAGAGARFAPEIL